MKELKIIVPENFIDFGKKVNEHINEYRNNCELVNYLIEPNLVRFNNGEGKAVLTQSVRDADLYILTDVSNHDITYPFFGYDHHMSPDEHIQDVKRILSAECGHASKRTLIMPYLYESRQDKKDSRESLDCANTLKELENMGIDEFITCDVHNKGVMNAIPNTAFENVYLTDVMTLSLLTTEMISDFDNLICIAPDEGAMKRARFLSDILGNIPMGSFYKQRDYTKIVDGKHPIVAHIFNGPDLNKKNAIVFDDMIASGGSILDTAVKLKERGVNKVYLMVTFALFTEGIERFDEFYEKGYFDKVYASNVSYVPYEIVSKPWFEYVDCSYKIADIINELNKGNSIGNLISAKEDIAIKIRKLRREN